MKSGIHHTLTTRHHKVFAVGHSGIQLPKKCIAIGGDSAMAAMV